MRISDWSSDVCSSDLDRDFIFREFREIFADIVVERQLFLLDQLGRGERGELLRDRGRIKESVTIERLAGRDVAGAGCSDEESLPSAKSAGGASGRSEALRVGYDFPYLDDVDRLGGSRNERCEEKGNGLDLGNHCNPTDFYIGRAPVG